MKLYRTNKFLLKLILILYCSVNLSCSSFKEIKNNENRVILTKENINLLDGIYINNTEVKVLPMDYFWGKNYKMKEYNSVYKLVYQQKAPYLVRLKVLNAKQIQITIFVNDKILKSYVLKGKLDNGYFVQNRKMYMIPMLVFNVYHNSKFRIGKLKNNNLITDYSQKEYVNYVFDFINNSKNTANIEHIKVKDDTIK